MFWIIASALLLFGLAFIVVPLAASRHGRDEPSRSEANRSLYDSKVEELRFDLEKGLLDQSEYDDALEDLQRNLLIDIEEKESVEWKSGKSFGLIAAVTILIPLTSILLYKQFSTGSDQVLVKQQALSSQAQSLEASISALEQRLQENPDNIEGWKMLGQSNFIMRRYDKAIEAYTNAAELANHADPNIMVLLAEASAYSNGENFGDHEKQLLAKALQINPNHERALWYAGYAAYISTEFSQAVAYWDKLLTMVPTDRPDVRETLVKFLNDARVKAGLPEIDVAPAIADNATGEKSQRSITVSVELTEQMRDKVNSSDTLFIYARAANGPKMPLSLARLSVSDLPATVTLTEEMAMMPNMSLGQFDQVEAIARVSKSGQAITQAGDLIAKGISVDFTKSSSAKVSLSIDSIVP